MIWGYSRQWYNSNTIQTKYNSGVDISGTHRYSLHVNPNRQRTYHWDKHQQNIHPT